MKEEVLEEAQRNFDSKKAHKQNHVKRLFDIFEYDEVSRKIAEILKPEELKAELAIVYQTVPNLNIACPKNLGDWYFTGNYPTKGGNKVVNKAFINFMEGKEVRAY